MQFESYMKTDITSWNLAKASMTVGETVSCIVKEHHPFGVLVSLERTNLNGVIERIRMRADGYQTPDEYPPIGSVIDAIVLGFRDVSRQVELVLPRKEPVVGRHDHGEEHIEVGLRVGDDGEIEFFGIECVNEMLAIGKTVTRIEKGRAIMVKTGESEDFVKVRLKGFSVLVVVAAS